MLCRARIGVSIAPSFRQPSERDKKLLGVRCGVNFSSQFDDYTSQIREIETAVLFTSRLLIAIIRSECAREQQTDEKNFDWNVKQTTPKMRQPVNIRKIFPPMVASSNLLIQPDTQSPHIFEFTSRAPHNSRTVNWPLMEFLLDVVVTSFQLILPARLLLLYLRHEFLLRKYFLRNPNRDRNFSLYFCFSPKNKLHNIDFLGTTSFFACAIYLRRELSVSLILLILFCFNRF